MAKLNVARRITKEDFSPEFQPLVDQLGSTLNQFIEQVVQAFNKNLTIEDNLPFYIKTFNVLVDANGKPTTEILFSQVPKTRGVLVIRADNTQNTTALTGAPFCQFVSSNGNVRVTRILGLPANIQFSVSLMLII